MERPETKFEVFVRNEGEDNTRLAEFVRREDAYEFARLLIGRFANVNVGGIVRDLSPEPVHLSINLDGKTIAQAEAMLTRLERIVGQFDPYIDSLTSDY